MRVMVEERVCGCGCMCGGSEVGGRGVITVPCSMYPHCVAQSIIILLRSAYPSPGIAGGYFAITTSGTTQCPVVMRCTCEYQLI